MKINILGKEWVITYENESNNKILRKSEAYCDYSTRKIVINDEIGIDGNLEAMDYYKNKVIRHELIHAFFFESGLTQYFYDETLVEFLAIQMFKINDIFKEVGVE